MPGTLKGRFRPQHPEKYKGNPAMIEYRSSWELNFMKWLDSEKTLSGGNQKRKLSGTQTQWLGKSRYFPDFIIE